MSDQSATPEFKGSGLPTWKRLPETADQLRSEKSAAERMFAGLGHLSSVQGVFAYYDARIATLASLERRDAEIAAAASRRELVARIEAHLDQTEASLVAATQGRAA